MPKFSDLIGTSLSFFRIGFTGPRIKNNAGTVEVKNSADSAFAAIKALILQVTGNSIEINTNAASTGTDYKYSIVRPSTGMTAPVTLTLPPNQGTAGQFLQTDGSGRLSYVAAGSTDSSQKTDMTSIAVGAVSPVSMVTLPINSISRKLRVIVDVAYNGTPSLSVGISGNTAKYMATNQIDLSTVGMYEVNPERTILAAAEAVIATYVAGGATTGSARIEVDYLVPQ